VTGLDVVSAVLLGIGAVFFLAGTVGLLRFPDVYTRLHALTKADNVGLGFVVAGLAVHAASLAEVAKLATVWLLVMVSSSLSGQLVARSARRAGVEPWRRR
jgi:multicomponent Na+:H+ antiporter subunit G